MPATSTENRLSFDPEAAGTTFGVWPQASSATLASFFEPRFPLGLYRPHAANVEAPVSVHRGSDAAPPVTPLAGVEVERRAERFLTDPTVAALCHGLIAILGRFAEGRSVSVVRLCISTFVDPEEFTGELVLTQYVDLSDAAIFAYWDALECVIEEWAQSLADSQKRETLKGIAVEIRPAGDS